ncbi:hypothetical protein LZ31DRAFT_209447 [Colletotrichum somersetense]|nr:hypothetical protein LZ31DRAFT_209447 [Colletotrichum somersetense]
MTPSLYVRCAAQPGGRVEVAWYDTAPAYQACYSTCRASSAYTESLISPKDRPTPRSYRNTTGMPSRFSIQPHLSVNSRPWGYRQFGHPQLCFPKVPVTRSAFSLIGLGWCAEGLFNNGWPKTDQDMLSQPRQVTIDDSINYGRRMQTTPWLKLSA